MTTQTTGTEKFRWDLSFLYSDIDDKQIDIDVSELIKKSEKFRTAHKGRLSETLGLALADYSEIKKLENKIFFYLYCKQSLEVANTEIKAKMAEVNTLLSRSLGEYLTFFEIEIIALDDKTLQNLYDNDSIVKKHQPWIEYVRIFKPHILSEAVESALTKRSPFGPQAWGEFFDELDADLEFEFRGEKNTLIEMHNIIAESKDAEERFEAMTAVNIGLRGIFAKYSAQNLYMVTGAKAIETKERSYDNPMTSRNKSNRVPDTVVNALHDAVYKTAGPLTQKYYRLKAAHLGLKILKWSDRNAPLPFADTTIIPFDEAIKIVLTAYENFSPTLANIIRKSIDSNWIDAPALKGKRNGAFNYSIVLPGDIPISLTFLNYLGSNRDVMTLAHELGHGTHGVLAGKEQGALMFRAPTAYSETASVFGEMTTFNSLKKKLSEKGDDKSLLALLMGKIEDMLNTTVRQIGFSNFERRIHGMDAAYHTWHEPKKLSVEELNKIWLEILEPFYGKNRDIFTYDNMEYFWAYISHFHRPFYVYNYAFGEFLTQSIYAKQPALGDKFESLYLDLLKSGMTKDVIELLKPFNLDPTNESFWVDGINNGIKKMINEAEELSLKLGISI